MFGCNNKINCDTSHGVISTRDRIIVIGDLHADYNKALNIFLNLNIIDKNHNWICTPRDTVVVQLGDQVDGGGRGLGDTEGDEIKLIEFMDDIHEKAQKQGGGVFSLIGNHEIMNLLGDFRYASKEDIRKQGGAEKRKKLFSPGSKIFCKMACTRHVVLKVGNFLFCHAGVIPEHIENEDEFIKKINNLMKLYLRGEKDIKDREIQKYFIDKQGIIWNRSYGVENPHCDNLDKVTRKLKVGHMVIGHTIQENINSKCDNKLWRVDVGMSDAFGENNKVQVLEILNDGVSKPINLFNPFRITDIK